MRRDTLLDFFDDYTSADEPFIVHDDGYRVREITYRELASAARAFAARLSAERIGPGQKIVLWGENRPEWLIALWGALHQQVVAVPVDYRASADLVRRISEIVDARAVLVGDEVTAPAELRAPVWALRDVRLDVDRAAPPTAMGPRPTPQTLAEIIFTSGATADPKGVTITHRNVLANIIPIERELLATSPRCASARARKRFATLAQAISSTNPTAPNIIHSDVLVLAFMKLLRNGSTLAPQPVLDAGNSRARPSVTFFMSALA
jgi:long-subunit acyl-CoA synthetase (AMP-forming)